MLTVMLATQQKTSFKVSMKQVAVVFLSLLWRLFEWNGSNKKENVGYDLGTDWMVELDGLLLVLKDIKEMFHIYPWIVQLNLFIYLFLFYLQMTWTLSWPCI